MPEPLTSSGTPFRSWVSRVSGSGWGGLAFWSILIGVTVFLLISGYGAFVGANQQNLHFAFLGGISGFAATALGAVVAIALRDIAARTQDIMLGFAAGMMLAASSFSLILPGIEAAQALCDNQLLAACVVVAGLALGVALMVGLDRFVPHEHEKSGRRGPEAQRINRVWLFVLAITLHNLPEGMAIGVSFANGDIEGRAPADHCDRHSRHSRRPGCGVGITRDRHLCTARGTYRGGLGLDGTDWRHRRIGHFQQFCIGLSDCSGVGRRRHDFRGVP